MWQAFFPADNESCIFSFFLSIQKCFSFVYVHVKLPFSTPFPVPPVALLDQECCSEQRLLPPSSQGHLSRENTAMNSRLYPILPTAPYFSNFRDLFVVLSSLIKISSEGDLGNPNRPSVSSRR